MNQDRAQHLSDADLDLRKYLIRVAAVLGDVLSDSLAGLYVHGSLAAGVYRRRYSELALIAVVDRPLTASDREGLARAAIRLSDERPVPGDFVLTVLEERYARNYTDPLPYEMRYTPQLHEPLRRGRVDFARRNASAELAADLADVCARGLALVGPPAATIFGPVPWYAYINALRARLDGVAARAKRHPVEAILDACGVLAGTTARSMPLPSQEEAAVGALETIPPIYRAAVMDALQVYRGTKSLDDVVFHTNEIEGFVAYVAERSQPAFLRAADTDDDE
jgi:hypothetical protein